MKLGQLVTITQYLEPVSTSNKYWSDYIRKYGNEINPDVYEINRYAPTPININGVITGYKKITIKTTYKITKYPYMERDTGAEVIGELCKHVSSECTYIYVVQTSLKKKYFVIKDWIRVI